MFRKEPEVFREFEWKELHKKLGVIVVSEPTESDIAEGNASTKVLFVDEEMNTYVLSTLGE